MNVIIYKRHFTLIEIIVAILLSGILGLIVFASMSSSMQNIEKPEQRVSDSMDAQSVMADIFALYNDSYKSDLEGLVDELDGGAGFDVDTLAFNNTDYQGSRVRVSGICVKAVKGASTEYTLVDVVKNEELEILKVVVVHPSHPGEELTIFLTNQD